MDNLAQVSGLGESGLLGLGFSAKDEKGPFLRFDKNFPGVTQ
jgi:hypothetical protein